MISHARTPSGALAFAAAGISSALASEPYGYPRLPGRGSTPCHSALGGLMRDSQEPGDGGLEAGASETHRETSDEGDSDGAGQ